MNGSNDTPMTDFNLITHPWIPVRWLDGHHSSVGLDELFRRAADIADLDAVPHERISLIRLLVCITQAALGAPADYSRWEEFGGDLEQAVPVYLARPEIFPHFNLFGDGPRFLQPSRLEGSEPEFVSWIFFRLATGNNATQFDHHGGTERSIPPADIARALVTWQNFAPPMGQHTGDGVCSKTNSLHCILTSDSLRGTILLNCLDKETIENSWPDGFGRPVWEVILNNDPLEGTVTTYLGRLVPLHRRVWLIDCVRLRKDRQGTKFPSFKDSQIREPSVALRITEKGISLKGNWGDRSIWRDLEALGMDRQHSTDGQTQLCPLVVQSHLLEIEQFASLPVWVGALIFENTASLVTTVESTFELPKTFFTEVGLSVYSRGVEWAETQSFGVKLATEDYERALRGKNSKGPKSGFPAQLEAKQHYWNSLDQQRQALLDLVANPSLLGIHNFGESDDPWSLAVRKAAHAAYDHACPRTTPRQIEAYALGLRRLRPKSAKPKTFKTTPATT